MRQKRQISCHFFQMTHSLTPTTTIPGYELIITIIKGLLAVLPLQASLINKEKLITIEFNIIVTCRRREIL